MKRLLTTLLTLLLAGTLSARDAKVAVVMSKTSYGIAESETGSAGKAWTAVSNLAGLPYETLFVEDLKSEALDACSLLVLSQCFRLANADVPFTKEGYNDLGRTLHVTDDEAPAHHSFLRFTKF